MGRATFSWRAAGARLAGGLALFALLTTACSSGPPPGTPPIPTFPGPGAAPTSTSPPPPRTGILPTDCEQILSSEQLPNWLGMPLGSVRGTGLRDIPSPNVGRLERVTCNYTSLGGPGAPQANTLVLKVLASGYDTPPSAAAQAQASRDVLASQGVGGQPVPFGTAQATYFADPDGPVLVVLYGRVTASFTLTPNQPVPVDQSPPVLTDLALRAMPILVPAGS